MRRACWKSSLPTTLLCSPGNLIIYKLISTLSRDHEDAASMEEVTRRLIEYFSPEKIILYGSYGSAESDKESDIDLLIIKETEKSPHERRLEAEKILFDRAMPLDINVYTPGEVNYLFSIGSPFIEEVIEKGRLLYMRKATSSWIKDAVEESDSAEILYEHDKFREHIITASSAWRKG